MIGLMLLFKLIIRLLTTACYIKNISDSVTDSVTSTLNTKYIIVHRKKKKQTSVTKNASIND